MRLPVNHVLPLAALLLIAGCSGGGAKPAPYPVAPSGNGPASDYPIVVGEPFAIDGTTHTPIDKLNYDMVGHAVAGSAGEGGVSIAHKTLPLPSYAEITALDSGKTVLVRVERRGPMSNDRLVELSPGAAAQLGLTGTDKAPIRIRRVNPPEAERSLLRGGQRAPERMDTPPSLLAVLKRKLDPQMPVPVASPTPIPTPTPSASPSPAATPKPRAKPSPRATPTPRATPSPRPTPTTRATPTPRAVPSPRPTATPAPRPTSRPSPRPTPTPRPAASASPAPATAGNLVVQVGSFGNPRNASAAAAKVGGRQRASGAMSRVFMGPFANRAAAEAALAKARAAGYSDARIQRAD